MAAGNNPNSPRQKMINLMYLVFIAMMALNVSSEVLDGFEQVEIGLKNTISNSSKNNELVSGQIDSYYRINPEKVREWYTKSGQVRIATDSLYHYLQTLKERIVKHADGKNGNVNDIVHKDNLEAASRIMLSPMDGEGENLRKAIDDYRRMVTGLVQDTAKNHIIEANLSTEPPRRSRIEGSSWESALFENMPVAAAVTLLTKLQSDIRYAEGEVLNSFLNSVDISDYRVNQVHARVIPESQIVMRGSQYRANIVLSAVDSTKRPTIFVNGVELPSSAQGLFTINTSAIGTFPVRGYLEMPNNDGTTDRHEFVSEYYVTEPSATVAPTLMNVFYAGIDNPIRIAVPGIPGGSVSATMSNGQLTRNGDLWVARPVTVGTEAIVSVNARMPDGRTVEMAKTAFRVRALPDPMPYLEYKDVNGNVRKYRGGTPISKRDLLTADGILAAIDDDLLNVPFTVLRFEVTSFDSFGNAIPEVAEGTKFSERQKNLLRNVTRGKQLYITRVSVKGPDGVERQISPIQVIIR
jgi:gliding motility-associated protein GldM